MLTEEYLKNHFITAYYVDNERKMIEVQCSNDDNSEIIRQKMQNIRKKKNFLPTNKK